MNDVIELVTFSENQDKKGELIRTENLNEIFAERKSIKRVEFYQANANGFKPVFAFEINSFEYNDEFFIKYNGKPYKVIRTYQTDIDKVELVVEGAVNYG